MSISAIPALDLRIEGMSCASCVGRVEKALKTVPGVASAAVNLATETAHVELAGGTAADAARPALVAAVTKAGYVAHPFDDAAAGSDADAAAADRATADRLAAERNLALAALVLALPLLAGMVFALLGLPQLMPPAWAQFAIGTLVQFGLGWRFYRGAWAALRARSGNMDLLVALGTSAAWGLSTWTWLAFLPHADHGMDMPHLYFESSVAIIAFVRLGKWLEARAKGQTVAALRALAALKPQTARRRRADGSDEEIPSAQLRRGDLLVVRAGEAFAADGTVTEGAGSVDEAMLTGESLPVEKAPGDAIHAGTLNRDGLLIARVDAVGAETMLAAIVRLVETAQANKPPVQQLVDRISAVFVPVVVLVALITFTLTLSLAGDAGMALVHAIAVLVIACPCALGLATPATLMVGTGLAARRGILIRDAAALEQARDVKTVVFDKTGTLTEGKPVVTALVPAAGIAAADLLRQAAALQAGSQHPLGLALVQHWQAQSLSAGGALPPASGFRALAGRGVAASVAGASLLLGNARLMQESGIAIQGLQAEADRLAASGHTVSWLGDAAAKTALGLVAFGDTPKPGAARAVAALAAMGIQSVLLTGDNAGAARAVADALGIQRVIAEALPQDKARLVADLRSGGGGKVAMVGDGVNDAPALSAADLGIAMGTGTDVAMHSAGIVLVRGEPALVADAIALSRATDAKLKQNLFWAFAYNIVGIPLAAFGLLDPVLAGAAMALSSVSVLGNALLLRRWRPAEPPAMRQTTIRQEAAA